MRFSAAVTICAALSSTPIRAQPSQPALSIPAAAVPLTAANLAKAEYEKLAKTTPANLPYVRFVWMPTASNEEYAAVAVTVNMISRSAFEYTPPRVAGGALALIDFSALGDNERDIDELLRIWDRQGDEEHYFHAHVVVESEVIDAKTKKPAKGKSVFVSIPHPTLGNVGLELERYVGTDCPVEIEKFNGWLIHHPEFYSRLPVVRYDWFVRESITPINGGHYYDYIGVVSGKTTFDEFTAKHSASIAPSEKSNALDFLIKNSEVTGKDRRARVWGGQSKRPALGAANNFITDDHFDESIRFDPDSGLHDANLSLLVLKSDGHEIFIAKENGWVYCLLANGNNVLVDQAPPNLVADHSVVGPNPTILVPGASCIRCHGEWAMYRPFRSEIIPQIQNFARVLADLGHGQSTEKLVESIRQLRAFYGSEQWEVNMMLAHQREDFERRAFKVTGLHAEAALAATAKAHDDYEWGRNGLGISAADACREFGFSVDPKADPLGIEAFRVIVPPVDAAGTVAMGYAGLANRLLQSYEVTERQPDPATKQLIDVRKQRGMTLTRREFERIYPDLIGIAYQTQQNLTAPALPENPSPK